MASWELESDDRLLRAASADAGAFSAFYRRYERPILAYFLRRTRDPELAADLTAEVFAAVLVACGRYRPGGSPADAWLFGIARHKLISSRRRGRVADRARRRLAMQPIELDDSDLERVQREASVLTEMLAELPTDQREAVRARIIDEESYEEIAGRLECSSAVVRKRVSRGLASLRDRLGEEGA